MGPSVSFPLPLRIAQKLPVCNSWELMNRKLPIPLLILYYLELISLRIGNGVGKQGVPQSSPYRR